MNATEIISVLVGIPGKLNTLHAQSYWLMNINSSEPWHFSLLCCFWYCWLCWPSLALIGSIQHELNSQRERHVRLAVYQSKLLLLSTFWHIFAWSFLLPQAKTSWAENASCHNATIKFSWHPPLWDIWTNCNTSITCEKNVCMWTIRRWKECVCQSFVP